MNTLKSCFLGTALAINGMTCANGAIVAHKFIHEDIMGPYGPSDGEALLITFANATLGSFMALAYPAMDWRSGENPGYVSNGDTPISYLAAQTPDMLQIPVGVTVSTLGAPGSAIGNFVGSVTGYFAP